MECNNSKYYYKNNDSCEEPYDYKIGYLPRTIFTQKSLTPICSNTDGCATQTLSMCKYPASMYTTARPYFDEYCCGVGKYLSKI